MKYLQDDRLSALTSRFDYDLSGGLRHVQGRIEAYTMKRAGNDKKYAADLGIKYVSLRDSLENKLATTGFAEDAPLPDNPTALTSLPPLPTSRNRRAYSVGAQFDDFGMAEQKRKKARTRSNSLDNTTTNQNSSVYYKTALGDFADMATRRLMTDLILTLNMSFPDYDFDCVSPNDFEKCELPCVVHHVQSLLGDTAACITASQAKESRLDVPLEHVTESHTADAASSGVDSKGFMAELWSALDNVIHLSDCEVYLWKDHPEDLNQSQEGELVVWSFYYLFVNKTLKRIVFFSCCETLLNHSKSYDGESDMDVGLISEEDEDEELNHLQTDASECDFDLDPAAVTAGGIPISTV